MSDRRGLLLATMEPPPAIEEEFQDWYDTEHFPERAGCPGFLTAQRFICVDGWPRYLALYDLQDVQVLHGPDYAKFAGARYSPWTHRIMSRVWGQYRAEGVQLYPGQGLLGGSGAATRVLLCRFRQVPSEYAAAIEQGVRTLDARPETAQARLYMSRRSRMVLTTSALSNCAGMRVLGPRCLVRRADIWTCSISMCLTPEGWRARFRRRHEEPCRDPRCGGGCRRWRCTGW